MSSQNHWNKLYRTVIMATICLAMTGVGFAFWPKVNQFRSYQDIKSNLMAEIRAENENIAEFRLKQAKFRTDKRFVQKIAHEIGFAHEGETIFQFEEEPEAGTYSQSPPLY